MQHPAIHLASSSPRRLEILRSMGLTFSAAGVDIDERQLPGETPQDMALRLAAAKAEAVSAAAGQLVIGADTIVVVDDAALGKPRNQTDGLRMLAMLSDRTHEVLTGVAVRSAQGVRTTMSRTEVRFREIGPDEALAYWQSGEPCDKAGAYAIQGLGGLFVTAISGSYSGVVGLPVFETAELLRQAGIDPLRHSVSDA